MARKKFLHVIALIIVLFWLIQVTTGFFALGILSYELNMQYFKLTSIIIDGNYVFYIRQFHMILSNIVTLLIVMHIIKALSIFKIINANKFFFWVISALLFFLILITAFTGYIIVAGNMSFWAAIVILSLATLLPLIGNCLIEIILGNSVLNDFGIRRFTIVHFLLAVLSSLIMILHIILIHRSLPSSSVHILYDGNLNLSMLLIFDIYIISLIIMLIFSWQVWSLIHPDNWKTIDTLVTPSHIEPELYFLWLFSIIKFHNSKLAGFNNLNSSDISIYFISSIIAIQALSTFSAIVGDIFLTLFI